MNVVFQKTLAAGIYKVTVSTGNFSPSEQRAIGLFGEPAVDIGGLFYQRALGSTPASTPIVEIDMFAPSATPTEKPQYMHTSRMKKIQTDFGNPKIPFTIIFDGNTLGLDQALEDALLWIATMEIRINNIMFKLRQMADQFTGTQTETL